MIDVQRDISPQDAAQVFDALRTTHAIRPYHKDSPWIKTLRPHEHYL